MKRFVGLGAVLAMLVTAAVTTITVDFKTLFASGQSWTNVDRLAGAIALCDTPNFASNSLKGGKETVEAYVSEFGFSLNGGGGLVTIDGVEVRVHGAATAAGAIRVNDMWLIKDYYLGDRSPDSKGSATTWDTCCKFQSSNPFGSSTDTWGWVNPMTGTLEEADVEDSGYGIVMVLENSTGTGQPAVGLVIDAIEMTIYWSIDGTPQTPQVHTAGAAQEL